MNDNVKFNPRLSLLDFANFDVSNNNIRPIKPPPVQSYPKRYEGKYPNCPSLQ